MGEYGSGRCYLEQNVMPSKPGVKGEYRFVHDRRMNEIVAGSVKNVAVELFTQAKPKAR